MHYYNEIIMPDSRVNPFIMFAQRSGMIAIDKNKIALANNCSEGFFLYYTTTRAPLVTSPSAYG